MIVSYTENRHPARGLGGEEQQLFLLLSSAADVITRRRRPSAAVAFPPGRGRANPVVVGFSRRTHRRRGRARQR